MRKRSDIGKKGKKSRIGWDASRRQLMAVAMVMARAIIIAVAMGCHFSLSRPLSFVPANTHSKQSRNP